MKAFFVYYNTAHYLPLIIKTVLKYNYFRTFVPIIFHIGGAGMKDQYIKLIIEYLEKCNDEDLLDFVLKLLISEG